MSLDRLEAAPFARALAFVGWVAPSETLPARLLALDLVERVLIATVYGGFVWHMLRGYSGLPDVSNMLIVISEALPFLFVMLRSPSASLSRHPWDWTVAVLATVSPLLIRPEANAGGSIGPEALAFGVMLFGLCLQIAAKVVLGRRFGIVAANRGVRDMGPYRFVRHPMYAGYTLTHIGFLLAMPNPMNAGIYAFGLVLQIVRIDREERVLMQDPAYRAFAGRVRYRMLPGIY
jgi:protein-S-isoprenylcysteine O-methyltransferase Ste14